MNPPELNLDSDAGETVPGVFNMGRGAWVDSAGQAEIVRTQTNIKPVANAWKTRPGSGANFELVMDELKKIGIAPLIGGALFMVLIVTLARECCLALAYRDHLNAGLTALANGQADKAQVQFSLSIDADPKAADTYYYRALAEVRRGSTGNALNDYKTALDLDPDNLKAYLARAALHMKMHNYDQAVEDCSSVVRLSPDYSEAYRVRANAYNHQLKFLDAIGDSTKFLNLHQEMDSPRADALCKRAFALDQRLDYKGALQDYTDAIACDPDSGTIYGSRAIVRMQLGQWKRALKDCNIALRLKPDDPAIYKVRGICKAQLRQGEESVADLDKLVTLYPTVDTHRLRGDQRLVLHDYLGTLEDYDIVLRAEPDDNQTHIKYQKAKRALQALAPRTSATADIEPRVEVPTAADLAVVDHPELVKKGHDLFMSGDTEAAIAYLIAALERNPRDAGSRRCLAHALCKSGLHHDGMAEFHNLSAIDALRPMDKLVYARASAAANQPEKAIAAYTDLLASDPQNDRARTELIDVLLDSGGAAEAARLAEEGIHKSPSLQSQYSELLQRATASKRVDSAM